MTEEIRPTDAEERSDGNDPRAEEAMQRIIEALRGLRYGQVSIIVQDGVVIQIERTERTRLRRAEK